MEQQSNPVEQPAVRAAVLKSFRQTDGGLSFRDAVHEQGHVLARGDRRGLVVVYDTARGGGFLAVGKLLLGYTNTELGERFADLDPLTLPTVAEAWEILSQQRGRRRAPSA